MRRPVLWLAASFFTGIICGGGYKETTVCGFIVLSAMWFVGEVLWKVKWYYILAVAVMFAAGFVRMYFFEMPGEAFGYVEDEVWVTATGEADGISLGYGTDVVLRNVGITHNDKEYFVGGILVCMNEAADIESGDTVVVSGLLSSFDLPHNDGEFNTYNYYKSMGIYYKLEADYVSITERDAGLKGMLLELRKYLTESIFKYSYDKKDAGTITAMLLGDKAYLDKELKGEFQNAGISHILVVSGLHISLLGLGIFRLLRKIFRYGVSCSVASVCVILYTVMTGFGVSGRRALIMFLISMFAEYLGRTYDMLTSIAVALIIILFDTPFMFLNCGFLLSFLAVLGIALLCPVLEDVSRWLCGHKLSAIMAGISTAWATLPVSAYFFFEYPVFSIIINLIIIPCMPFLVVLGVISISGELVCGRGEILLKGPVHLVLGFYEKLCEIVADFEENMLLIGMPDLSDMMAVYVLLILCAVFYMVIKQLIKRGFKLPGVCKSFIFRLCVWVLLVAGVSTVEVMLLKGHAGRDELRVTMIDVGQGDSFLVEFPNGETMLIDCGSSSAAGALYSERMEAFFNANAINRLDYIMVSHGDEDHCNAVVDILSAESGMEVGMLMVPEFDEDETLEELCLIAGEMGVRTIELSKGEDFTIGEVAFDVLNPPGSITAKDDKNDNSLVVILSYGEFDMLFTGDIGGTREAVIAPGLKECEVLKVAHHGSGHSTSEEFLGIVSPEVSLISCGRNNSYGHPSLETLERLSTSGAEIYVTAECGQTTIVSDGREYKVRCYYAEP